jgi:lipoyl(octanoyl) transferase
VIRDASPAAPPAAYTRSPAPALEVRWLGRVPYGEAVALQKRLVAERRAGAIPDQLLLLEHDHVITLGTSSHAEHVLVDEAERRLLGIELFESGRGGDVTYHGPGQLVGYPILALEPERRDLHRYVRDLEAALIRALADVGITAGRIPGLTGVWVGERKIAAIGVRVSSGWITSHGFALNVSTELAYFDAIVPCGIRDRAVTSVAAETGRTVAVERVGQGVAHEVAQLFGRTVAIAVEASANTSRRA